MPIFKYGSHEVYYQTYGEEDAPVIAFVNGLSMRTLHWMPMIENLCSSGFRVLVYDMLGQGSSSKPVLDMNFDNNAEVLALILDEISTKQAYVSGISYGGVVALKFGYLYPEKSRGIIPISTFTEMDGQFKYLAYNLHRGLTEIGFGFYLDLLMPLNFTSGWIDEHSNVIDFTKRIAIADMEVYGIQNVMEQLASFESITDEISKIKCPTLIMNGEFDSFTPRHMHEIMRQQIRNSRLILVPKVAHAMTIEIPDLCCQIIANFIEEVESNNWKGDQTTWIANEELGSHPVAIPCEGDYLRCIPIELSRRCYEEKRTAAAQKVAKPVTKKTSTVTAAAKKSAAAKTTTKKATTTKKPAAKN
ncbi:MAG: alpha/beta hydrolase [Gammaproteobacteria bacterium]|nr:MAG: alpha/beta hydrolase [Gammaproteobacteria bacterium]